MKTNARVITVLLIILFLAVTGGNAEGQEESGYSLPRVELPAQVVKMLNDSQWEDALEKLKELREVYNADPNIDHYVALCYGNLGKQALDEKRYDDAVSLFQSALEYTTGNPYLYLGLGHSHMLLSNYTEAEDVFQALLGLEPEHVMALRMLGEIYYLDGNLEHAVLYLEKALDAAPENVDIKKRLNKVKKQLENSHDMETEMGSVFMVRFDGNNDPRLRENVLTILLDIYNKIGEKLNLFPKRQILVTLLTKKQFFDITGSPRWSGGVYEGQIKIPAANYKMEILEHVLCHEYIHAVIFDAMSVRCPWWLNEGIAQYFSGDDKGNRLKLEAAPKILAEHWEPDLEELPGNIANDGKKAAMAYAIALSALDYFIEEFGVFELQNIMDEMVKGGEFGTIFQEQTGFTFKEFQARWKESLNPG